MNKIECEFCGQVITTNNYKKHLRRHQNHPETFKEVYKVDHDDLFCKFCGKECKNLNSLTQHEIRCKENPDYLLLNLNYKPRVGFNNIGRTAWNKGLTKETDDRVLKQSQTFALNKDFHQPCNSWMNDLDKLAKANEGRRQKALDNNLGSKGFHGKAIDYNGIKLDSSYELIVAQQLDMNQVHWVRPNKGFPYYDQNNKFHRYMPDFYLPEYDVYLDPKNDALIEFINSNGYNDKQKIQWCMDNNDIKVIILTKDELTWDKIKYRIENKLYLI